MRATHPLPSPRVVAIGVGVLVLGALLFVVVRFPAFFRLLGQGDEKPLAPPAGAPPGTPTKPGQPSALVLALDGVDRAMLYTLLREGRMPNLAALLGGRDARAFPHAHLDETVLSTLPSSTLAAWATVFTGTSPGEHGVAGNEYFIRASRTFAAPAPVSVLDPEPVMLTYTDEYADRLLAVPTIYERFKRVDPSFSAWVSMSQFHRGADRLLFVKPKVIADAIGALLEGALHSDDAKVYAELDRATIETVCEALLTDAAPRLLTIYLTGIDHYAHGADSGPDRARLTYLPDVIDPLVGRLRACLGERDALRDRYVVVVSDHGHTEVVADEAHALGTERDGHPPGVLEEAGFRLRPSRLEVAPDADFQAVLAYGGALAYVYLADRSTCPKRGQACDWKKPPRHEEDVLAAAEAFYRANAGAAPRPGAPVPKEGEGMKGALDLILVRRPGGDGVFDVYAGGGRTRLLSEVMRERPTTTYVELESRLLRLTRGHEGDHAGDLILMARNGDEPATERRFYFAGLYRSWHGSPSRKDSEVPLVVAHPSRSADDLAAVSRRAFGGHGPHGGLEGVGPLLSEVLGLGPFPR